MKNTKYKIILFIIIGILIYPSMVMAVWWNPLSWFNNWNFNKIETQTIENRKINDISDVIQTQSEITPQVVEKTKPVINTEIKKEKEIEITTPIVNIPQITPTQTQEKIITQQLDPKLLEVAKQMLNTNDDGILLIKNTYQTQYNNALKGQELCNSAYNNNVTKAESDAEYLKQVYLESRSGFATSTGSLEEIEDALSYDLETCEINKASCLSKYRLPNSSIPQKLNDLSSRVLNLRLEINTPEDAIKYQNEIKTLSNDILSVADLFRIY